MSVNEKRKGKININVLLTFVVISAIAGYAISESFQSTTYNTNETYHNETYINGTITDEPEYHVEVFNLTVPANFDYQEYYNYKFFNLSTSEKISNLRVWSFGFEDGSEWGYVGNFNFHCNMSINGSSDSISSLGIDKEKWTYRIITDWFPNTMDYELQFSIYNWWNAGTASIKNVTIIIEYTT